MICAQNRIEMKTYMYGDGIFRGFEEKCPINSCKDIFSKITQQCKKPSSSILYCWGPKGKRRKVWIKIDKSYTRPGGTISYDDEMYARVVLRAAKISEDNFEKIENLLTGKGLAPGISIHEMG